MLFIVSVTVALGLQYVVYLNETMFSAKIVCMQVTDFNSIYSKYCDYYFMLMNEVFVM